MPLLSLESYAELTPAERTRQIGALLEKALVRYYRNQRAAQQSADPGGDPTQIQPKPWPEVTDDGERQILHYIGRTGETRPLDLYRSLSLSRATVMRKLKRLRASGLLVATGKTAAARYRLAPVTGRSRAIG